MAKKNRPGDAVEAYKRAFPGAFVGMVYRDRILKHIQDLDVWMQVLQTERERIKAEKTNAFPVTILIQNYQREMKRWREIETPPDRNPAHQLRERGEPVDFRAALELLSEEKRADMLRLFEEERQKTIQHLKDTGYQA